jgi:protein subunit release factor A
VELAPEDLGSAARMEAGSPCGVRVTHTPTGASVWVDDQASTEENRDIAVSRLQEKMSVV